MNCEDVLRRISDYLDGELPAKEMEALEEHWKACSRCREEYESLSQTVSLVRALPRAPVPKDFAREVGAKIRRGKALEEQAPAERLFSARRIVLRWAPVAAAAVVLLFVGRTLFLPRQKAPGEEKDVAKLSQGYLADKKSTPESAAPANTDAGQVTNDVILEAGAKKGLSPIQNGAAFKEGQDMRLRESLNKAETEKDNLALKKESDRLTKDAREEVYRRGAVGGRSGGAVQHKEPVPLRKGGEEQGKDETIEEEETKEVTEVDKSSADGKGRLARSRRDQEESSAGKKAGDKQEKESLPLGAVVERQNRSGRYWNQVPLYFEITSLKGESKTREAVVDVLLKNIGKPEGEKPAELLDRTEREGGFSKEKRLSFSKDNSLILNLTGSQYLRLRKDLQTLASKQSDIRVRFLKEPPQPQPEAKKAAGSGFGEPAGPEGAGAIAKRKAASKEGKSDSLTPGAPTRGIPRTQGEEEKGKEKEPRLRVTVFFKEKKN